jgi:hypothetical protein
VGEAMALLLVAYGIWRMFQGELVGGLWMVLIALFIRSAARMSYQHHLMGQMQDAVRPQGAEGYHHRPGMTGRDVTTPGGDEVQEL